MKAEAWSRNGWLPVDGMRVGVYFLVGSTLYSPRFWRKPGETTGHPIPKKEFKAGPFRKTELDQARTLAEKTGCRVVKKGSAWWVQ